MEHYQEAFVKCGTTKGPFTMRLTRKLSPLGYDRAVALFQRGFYDHSHFFRTVHGFLVQFGISYTTDEELRKLARDRIRDDPQLDPPIPFHEGTVSFAGGGKNSRTSQLFIAYVQSNHFGKELWETPIGKVVEGMDNVRDFYTDYGDMPPWGNGPEQGRITTEGSGYMEKNFPLMDKFEDCQVEIYYPNLLDYDEADAKYSDLKEQEQEQGLVITRAAKKLVETNAKDKINMSGNLRKSDRKSTFPIALAVIAVVIIIACLLRRRTKRAEKTN